MSNDSFVGDALHPAARVLFSAIGTVMVLSGVLGNIVLICVIFKQFVRKRCAHHLFIANLALADLVTLGYWFTFLVLDLLLGYHPVVNEAHCRVNAYLIGTTLFATINFLTTVSLNRYLHVCHSRLYKRFFTIKTSVAICLAIWVAGFIVSIPPVFKGVPGSFHYDKAAHVCTYDHRKGFTYPKAMVIFFTIVPIFFIGYWNWAIFRFWRSKRMNVKRKYGPQGKTPEPQGKPKHHSVIPQQSHQFNDAVSGRSLVMKDPISVMVDEEEDESSDDAVLHNTFDLDRKVDEAVQLSAEDVPAIVYGKTSTVLRRASSETVDDDDNSEALTNARSDTLNRLKSAPRVTCRDDDSSEALTNAHSRDALNRLKSASRVTHRRETEKRSHATMSLTHPTEGADADGETNQSPSLRTARMKPLQRRGVGAKADLGEISKTNTYPLYQGRMLLRRSHMESVRRRQKKKRAKEVGLVRSLFVVSILFIAFFLPFGVIQITSLYIVFPSEVIVFAVILVFFNNSVNWIVYGAFNPSIRKGYVQCLLALTTCPAIPKTCQEHHFKATFDSNSSSLRLEMT